MKKVVTICGSSRFIQIMAVCAWLLEKEENAITMGLHLLPDWYCKVPDHLAEHENCASQMDDLHLEKIQMSDEIFVVNYNGYFGDSTKREIEHAKKLNKKIRWFTSDEIGYKIMKLICSLNPTDFKMGGNAEVIFTVKINKGKYNGQTFQIITDLDQMECNSLPEIIIQNGYLECWCNNNEYTLIYREVKFK